MAGPAAPVLGGRLAPHGTRIYAYRHFLTKQNTSVSKQLAFAGKKSVPRALRKDHWKPFFTVELSTPEQGLNVYKKLREWRMLHELSWKPEDLPELPKTTEELDELRDANEKREELGGWRKGGPRKRLTETKRKKKKLIMRQTENSVADLAAVLLEQEKKGTRQYLATRTKNQKRVDELIDLTVNEAARAAKIKKLREKIAAQETGIKAIKDGSGSRRDWKKATMVKNMTFELRKLRKESYFIDHMGPEIFRPIHRETSRHMSIAFATMLNNALDGLQDPAIVAAREECEAVLQGLGVSVETALSRHERSASDEIREEQTRRAMVIAAGIMDSDIDDASIDAYVSPNGSEQSTSANSSIEALIKELDTGHPPTTDTPISEALESRSPEEQSRIMVLGNKIAERRIADVDIIAQELLKLRKKARERYEIPETQRQQIIDEAKAKFLETHRLQSLSETESERPVISGGSSDTSDLDSGEQDIMFLPSKQRDETIVQMKLRIEKLGSVMFQRTVGELGIKSRREWQVQNPWFEGVSIYWANPLDAEYGEVWPARTRHETMGLTGHTAPGPRDRMSEDIEDVFEMGENNQLLARIGHEAPRAKETRVVRRKERRVSKASSGKPSDGRLGHRKPLRSRKVIAVVKGKVPQAVAKVASDE